MVQLCLNISDGGLYEGEQFRGREDEDGAKAGTGVGYFGVTVVVLLGWRLRKLHVEGF